MLIVVCDKPSDINTTKNVFSKFISDHDNLVCFVETHKMLQYIENHSVDVLIMDIGQPYNEYLSIVDKIEKLCRKINIIFISSDINCVPYLYHIDHEYFLLKPFSLSLVKDSIEKVRIRSKSKDIITVHRGHRINRIDIENAVYFEAIGHNVKLYRYDNTTEIYKISISVLERMGEKLYLSRCHRSFIANMRMVKDVKSGVIIMRNGIDVPIGRNYQKSFEEKLIDFCGEA